MSEDIFEAAATNPIEDILANANVLTEAFPEEFESSKGSHV